MPLIPEMSTFGIAAVDAAIATFDIFPNGKGNSVLSEHLGGAKHVYSCGVAGRCLEIKFHDLTELFVVRERMPILDVLISIFPETRTAEELRYTVSALSGDDGDATMVRVLLRYLITFSLGWESSMHQTC